jgi:alkanesulfonate monooxygenase SsuD/methylene tetrahydromethanopterin reductase-like flavin-dependent oxidoreductase (luciferase family)
MTRPRPPIFAASGSDYGKEIIAQYCDTWFISHEPGLAAYESNTHKIAADIAEMRARADRHGRTLGYGLSTYVICADTLDAALHEAAEMEQIPEANVAAKALGAGLVHLILQIFAIGRKAEADVAGKFLDGLGGQPGLRCCG